MEKKWIVDVLHDLKTFCELNDLNLLKLKIEEAIKLADQQSIHLD